MDNIVTLANIRSDTNFRQAEMQPHEHSIFEDDADTFNFLTVAFCPYELSSSGFITAPTFSSYNSVTPVTPENDELSPLLATPVAALPAHDTTRIESSYVPMSLLSMPSSPNQPDSGFTTYEVEGDTETPGAPVVKDLDSFTEGTNAGSFADFADEDDAKELALGTLLAHPESCNPNTSIIEWIEDVRVTHQFSEPIAESNAPWVGSTDLPEDPFHMEALEATEALLGDFTIDVDAKGSKNMSGDDNGDGDNVVVGVSVGPRIPSPNNLIPPMSAPLTAMTPRVMKRARSRSPASQTSRRVRSRSLSSIHRLPFNLTTLPPWRSNHPFKEK